MNKMHDGGGGGNDLLTARLFHFQAPGSNRWAGDPSISYLRGAGFKFRPERCLSWLRFRFFVTFLSFSSQMTRQYFKWGHGRFLSHPFQYIIHSSSIYSMPSFSKIDHLVSIIWKPITRSGNGHTGKQMDNHAVCSQVKGKVVSVLN
jgi:hypothetical protein